MECGMKDEWKDNEKMKSLWKDDEKMMEEWM